MKQCSASENSPPKAIADAIRKREKAKIEYPADGKLIGDWKAGEKLAQSGYGLRFTDYPARQTNGGNCYACHQLTKAEVSYGTIGPSLLGYGKIRKFSEADTKAVYEKIYNAQAAYPVLEHAALRHQQGADHRPDQGPGRAGDEPGQPGEQVVIHFRGDAS